MHLMKAEGDSTLQILESCFNLKEETKITLPEQTIISSMDWLCSGQKVVISGTNMPITVLDLQSSQDKGINSFKIGRDEPLST